MNQDLITGIDDIDHQNQALLDHLDILHDSMRRGQSRGALRDVLQFLESYVVEHFNRELTYMNRYRYPDMLQHKAEHETFQKDILAFKEKYTSLKAQGEITTFLGLDLVRKLQAWFDTHVSTVDRKMSVFLKEQMGTK
ncbi:MAG TPA: bacteriohemerythrin [Nitrospirota bacterium]|nr:bacteriohemerythrin [Nitrospirota bacterium]